MMKKYIIIFIIAVIVLPFALNEILMCEQIRPYVGNVKDWLGFWGSYLGAIIPAITAFVILFITYKQNKKQIKYQQATEGLFRLKEAFVRFNDAFDYRQLSTDIGKCKSFSDPDYVFKEAEAKVAILKRQMESAYMALELSFSSDSVDRTEINKDILDSKGEFVETCNSFINMRRGDQCQYELYSPDRMRIPSVKAIHNYINKEQQRINNILL